MLNNVECPRVPELATECKKIFHLVLSGRITLEESQKKIALLALDPKYGYNELRTDRPMPTPPRQLLDYRTMSQYDKKQYMSKNPDFLKSSWMRKYRNDSEMIEHQNESDKQWLNHIEKYREVGGNCRELEAEFENGWEV